MVVEAPAELKNLFERLEGVSQVVVHGEPIPKCDFQIPLLSLPYVFQSIEKTFPSEIPYLHVDVGKSRFWKERLNRKEGEQLIGIAWQGSRLHQRDQMRSPGLGAVAPLFDLGTNYRFISLQKEGDSAKGVEDYTPDLETFDDTAALISNLDRIVTPDTVIAHLAGALGIDTLVMLPFASEWRWLENRADSPWYPKSTLIRQPSSGDWSSCIARIKEHLLD